jgi:glucokinase
MALFIGLDLGGTNIKYGLVDDTGKVHSKGSMETRDDEGPGVVLDQLATAANESAKLAGAKLADVAGIGVGAPGMIDFDTGTVLLATNMKGWTNIRVVDEVTRRTGRPVALENDANAAAFGEYWSGAAKHTQVKHMIMLTLGTGVGSGIVVDGQLVHGGIGLAGEAGHLIVVPGGRPCPCGQKGCLEQYASASSVARRAIEALEAGGPDAVGSSLRLTLAQDRSKITCKFVYESAYAGDALAKKVTDETSYYLGIACVTLCRVLDPQMIVFAGGLSLAGEPFFEALRKVVAENSWKLPVKPADLVPAKLGNDAGFIGAAAVAWSKHR